MEEGGTTPELSLKSPESMRGRSSTMYSSHASLTFRPIGWLWSFRIRHRVANCWSGSKDFLQGGGRRGYGGEEGGGGMGGGGRREERVWEG